MNVQRYPAFFRTPTPPTQPPPATPNQYSTPLYNTSARRLLHTASPLSGPRPSPAVSDRPINPLHQRLGINPLFSPPEAAHRLLPQSPARLQVNSVAQQGHLLGHLPHAQSLQWLLPVANHELDMPIGEASGWQGSRPVQMVQLTPGLAGKVGVTFGSELTGRAAYEFIKSFQVEVETFTSYGHGAPGHNRRTLPQVLKFFTSRLDPTGAAHVWGEHMTKVLPDRFRQFLMRWVNQASADPRAYAKRCRALLTDLHNDDLEWEDPLTGTSLGLILYESHVEYLQQNTSELQQPVGADMSAIVSALHTVVQAAAASAVSRSAAPPPPPAATSAAASGGAGGEVQESPAAGGSDEEARDGVQSEASAAAGEQGGGQTQPRRWNLVETPTRDASGQESRAAGAQLGASGGVSGGWQGFQQPPSFGAGPMGAAPHAGGPVGMGQPRSLTPRQKAEQTIMANTVQRAKPPFLPPQSAYISEAGPAYMPRLPQLTAISNSFSKTQVAATQYEQELFASPTSTCPPFATYVCKLFHGQYVNATTEERLQLEHFTIDHGDAPLAAYNKLMAMHEMAGGHAKVPVSKLNEIFMTALLAAYPAAAVHGAVKARLRNAGKEEETAATLELQEYAQHAYEDMVGTKHRMVHVKTQLQAGGSRGGLGASGHQGGGSRGQPLLGQQRGSYGVQPTRRAQAHAAEMVEYLGFDPAAYAAEQHEPLPEVGYHQVAPPVHTARWGGQGGGSGMGAAGRPRTDCDYCGELHGPKCGLKQPGDASPYWFGPHTVPDYVTYLRNCPKNDPQFKPLPYRHGDVRDQLPADLRKYLDRVGTRPPQPRPPNSQQPQGQRSQSQGQRSQAARQAGGSGRGRGGYMADSATRSSRPSLSESFRHGTTLYAEEGQDDAHTAYFGHGYLAESASVEQPAEAYLTDRRTSPRFKAAAEQSAARQAQQQATAAQAGEGSAGKGKGKGVQGQQGGSTGTGAGVAGTQAEGRSVPLADRPPLPRPVVAGRRPVAGVGQASAAAPAAAPVAVPPEAASGQVQPVQQAPTLGRVQQQGRAQPLPFTTLPIAEGTPPGLYPTPVPRYSKGPQLQQAVARGSIMQQLPVMVSLDELARQLQPEQLKQVLTGVGTKLVVVQSATAQRELGVSDVSLRFSSMSELLQLTRTSPAFAADGEGLGDIGAGFVGDSQVACEAPALLEAGGELQVATEVAAMCAAELEAAGVAVLEDGHPGAAVDAAVATGMHAAEQDAAGMEDTSRATTFEVMPEGPGVQGLTIRDMDENGSYTRVLKFLHRLILDSGADTVLVSEHFARLNNLVVVPTDRRIRTSSGEVTGTLGRVAQPLQFVLCIGTDQECAVLQEVFVMPGAGSAYTVLLATPLIRKWGLMVDPLTSIATFRTRWYSHKDSRTLGHLPVLTAIEETPAVGGAAVADSGSSYDAADLSGNEPQVMGPIEGQEGQAAVAAVLTEVPAAPSSSEMADVYEPPSSFVMFSM